MSKTKNLTLKDIKANLEDYFKTLDRLDEGAWPSDPSYFQDRATTIENRLRSFVGSPIVSHQRKPRRH